MALVDGTKDQQKTWENTNKADQGITRRQGLDRRVMEIPRKH